MRCPRVLGWGFLFIAGYIIFIPSPIGLHLAFHSTGDPRYFVILFQLKLAKKVDFRKFLKVWF